MLIKGGSCALYYRCGTLQQLLPGGMMPDRTTVIFLGVIATGLWAFMAPAFAGGAVAIGLPSDVAKDGVSLGLSSNYTEVEAKRRAMANCPKISKSLCKVLTTFKDQCATAAIDPQAGTPGFGWSLGANIQDAEKKALAKCEETAGPKRRGACVVRIKGTCDGSAK
jgi:hypothetical protein